MKRIVVIFMLAQLVMLFSCGSDEFENTGERSTRATTETQDSICIGLNCGHMGYFTNKSYLSRFCIAFYYTPDSVYDGVSLKYKYHMYDGSGVLQSFKDSNGNTKGVYSMCQLANEGHVYSGYNGMLVINTDMIKEMKFHYYAELWTTFASLKGITDTYNNKGRLLVCLFDSTGEKGWATLALKYALTKDEKHYYGTSAYWSVNPYPVDCIDVLCDSLKK